MQSFQKGRASTPQPTPAPLKLGVGPDPEGAVSAVRGETITTGSSGNGDGDGGASVSATMPTDNITAVTVYLNPNLNSSARTSASIADSAPISPATVPPPAATTFLPAAEAPAPAPAPGLAQPQPHDQNSALASASNSNSAAPPDQRSSRNPTHQSSISNATSASASASATTFNTAQDQHPTYQQQLGAPNDLDIAIRQLLEQQADIQARLNVLLAHQHGFDPAYELSMLQHKCRTLEGLVHHHGKYAL